MVGTDAQCARSWVTSAWSPPNSAAEGEDTPAAARGWGRGAGVERELQLRAVTLHRTAEAPGTLVRAQRRGGLAKGCLLRGPEGSCGEKKPEPGRDRRAPAHHTPGQGCVDLSDNQQTRTSGANLGSRIHIFTKILAQKRLSWVFLCFVLS